MKLLKVFFLFFLFLIACFSLYHLITVDKIIATTYIFVIFSVFLFSGCFLRVILKIKLGGKYLSLEEEVESLQVEQEKLTNITTSLYKLIAINYADKIHSSHPEMSKKYTLVSEELTKFFNEKDVLAFMDELILIQKKRNST